MGMVYQRGQVWWIKYYRDGVCMRESSASDKESVAKNVLRQREGDIAKGVAITPQTNRVRLEELFKDLLNDMKANGRKSVETVEFHVVHLKKYFGNRRGASITVADLRAYIVSRQEKGAKNSTINRELQALNRALQLGVDAGKLTHKPRVRKLTENNVRTGFFESAQFDAVRSKLAAPLRPLVTFAFLTGWRRGEVLGLQWRQVDLGAGTVRLEVGSTKNGDGRVFPLTAELRRLLEQQRAHTDAVQREKGMIVPWVFHRDGAQVREFKRAWKTACKNAGCPGMRFHDFRRSAVRGFVRAGVPERVAMTLTGHRTRSIFDRYHIVSESDLTEAARKLDTAAGTITGTIQPVDSTNPVAATSK